MFEVFGSHGMVALRGSQFLRLAHLEKSRALNFFFLIGWRGRYYEDKVLSIAVDPTGCESHRYFIVHDSSCLACVYSFLLFSMQAMAFIWFCGLFDAKVGGNIHFCFEFLFSAYCFAALDVPKTYTHVHSSQITTGRCVRKWQFADVVKCVDWWDSFSRFIFSTRTNYSTPFLQVSSSRKRYRVSVRREFRPPSQPEQRFAPRRITLHV